MDQRIAKFCSEQWDIREVRQRWPNLDKNAQAYIACFETMAQLALAMTAVSRMRAKHLRFVLPAASDNTAAESGVNRLFTTTDLEPLSGFPKIVAAWSAHDTCACSLLFRENLITAWYICSMQALSYQCR